ncbi:MAG: hypothetical protein AB7O21_08225 [Gammaproteobacteria bacterium]
MPVFAPFHAPQARLSPLSQRRRVSREEPASACDAFHVVFPNFALDVRLRGVDHAPPCVLVDGAGAIVQANTAAIGLGARPGVPAARARAFAPGLRTLERDRRGEAELTAHILRWLRARGFDAGTTACSTADHADLVVLSNARDGRLAEVRHALRVFGVRHTIAPARATGAMPDRVPMVTGRAGADCVFAATLTLPWALTRAHDLHSVVERLLEGLQLMHAAERFPVTHVQWTFEHVDGTCDHHAFALGGTPVASPRLGAWIRERLHRLPPAAPWRAVTLKAGR